MSPLEIIYQDEDIIAINKPHGLLVHRTEIARDVREFAVQILRDQIGSQVYPAHRLDRKTSGVLLFALNEAAASALQVQFEKQMVGKRYLAIVRGYTDDAGEIDYPLKKENGNLQDAFTAYRTLNRAELPIAMGPHDTQRYSMVEVIPRTGRMHQIRRHFAHIHHPIIGDRPHGCNKQNRLFKERWSMDSMMLHAEMASFIKPGTEERIVVKAARSKEFLRVEQLLFGNVEQRA